MSVISTAEALIHADPQTVFTAVADIDGHPERQPDVVRIDVLKDADNGDRVGVGTQFREIRKMGSREMESVLDITEFESPRHARMVCDSHGTIWDSTFTVEAVDASTTRLRIHMDASTDRLVGRIMNRLMKPLFTRGMRKHANATKAWCEAQATNTHSS